MLVSRNALQSWPTLKGANNVNYFATRDARNAYFDSTTAVVGQYTAIGGDPKSSDWTKEEWEIDRYDGANWATVNLSKNFALIITNEGIKALTNASAGQYKLEISRIAIKQTPIGTDEDVATWTHSTFVNSNTYADICLDTNNLGNPTFTLKDDLTYRTNLTNGGIQFTVQLGLDCLGQQSVNESTNISPTLTEFNVAAIGLYVKDQRNQETNTETLFAVANLPTTVEKLASTPQRVGNSLKFYLNTTLSNLGNVISLQTVTSSVGSVPEVVSEDDLVDNFDQGVIAPYNLYLVDNYNNTNIPAIAVRKGNPVSTIYPVKWTYFTPTDDSLHVDSDAIDPTLQSYMVAAWDKDTSKYVPANSINMTTLAGLYVNNYILYSGKVTNNNSSFIYRFDWNIESAINYKVNDVLTATINDVVFTITVIAVDDLRNGKPVQFHVTPAQGVKEINTTNLPVTNVSSSGQGLTVNITSNELDIVSWNFPTSWINKPLFVDYDHTQGEPKETTWESYCEEADLDPTTAKQNRVGLLTSVENEFTISHFVGWCITENSIKLALDLRNEASETTYGTTRYARDEEVGDVHNNQDSKATTSVTPEYLNKHYLQKTRVAAGNPGYDRNNPEIVDTYTKFTKSIECIGTDLNGVAFKGTAYRALWADLAEYYHSDKIYPAGTLICIGDGLAEITLATIECNGIISTKPGYELGEKNDEYDLPVALIGKVPVLFAKDCMPKFGDRIYLSKTEPGKASTTPYGNCLGKIIDKRDDLHKFNTLMCSVRINF